MAFKIGDNVVYGAVGVMTVVDMREESFLDEAKEYYLLSEYGRDGSSVTYVPTDNERLVSAMRPLLSRDEALSAIKSAKEADDIEWPSDNRKRSETFKTIVESGDRALIMIMIRTIHNAGLRRAAIGKKNFLTDDNAMKKAERLISSEFALSLGVSEAEVRRIIEEDIKGVIAQDQSF